MDTNYHVNRIKNNHSNPGFYSGSSNRQYGSGIGSAIKLGLRGFVIPMVKKYGLPLAKNFVKSATPELLGLMDGSVSPKQAMKNSMRKTIKSQVGGRAVKRRRKKKFTKKRKPRKQSTKRKRPKKQRKGRAKRRKKSKTKPVKHGRRHHFGKNTARKTVNPRKKSQNRRRKNSKKLRSRQDFFSSIVDRA